MEESRIDKEVQDKMNAERIALAVSDEKELRRAELNFYAEFLSQMQKLNGKLNELSETLNAIGKEKIIAFIRDVKSAEKQAIVEKVIENKRNKGGKPKKSV